MITVGLIGTGYIGPVHLEALSRIGGVKVKTICDVNPDLAKSTAETYNVEHTCADYKDVLKDPEIDAIHICTPNKLHYAITKEAIAAGKHILAEKPLAMTLAEAEELVKLADNKGIVNGVDFCYRYYPVVQEMKARIARGDLGDVRLVKGSYLQDWLSKETDYSWRLEKSETGESNVTADLGSHWFDLVQFVTDLTVDELICNFSTIIPVRKKPKKQMLAFEKAGELETEDLKVELEEYSASMFHLSNGAPGSFTTCEACAGRKSDTEFQIYGSKCSMAWNHKRSTELWIGHRDKANEVLTEAPVLMDASTARYATLPGGHPLGYHDAVLNLFKDFYDVIKTGKETAPFGRPTFKTGLDEMRVLDAAIKSNKERQWKKVS